MKTFEEVTGAWVITDMETGVEIDRVTTTLDPSSSSFERCEMGLYRQCDLDRFCINWRAPLRAARGET